VEIKEPNIPHFDEKIRNLMYFQIFGFYWTTALLSAIFQMSVAGAIASWYFSRDIHGYGNVGSPALVSFGRALTKSFGSLAFGALILAIVQFINFLINQARRTNKNKVVGCVLCLIRCCTGCFERFIKFIDRFTYISIAMHGEGFFKSAKDVYELVSRNIGSAVVADFLGSFILFVGKLFGTAACVILIVAATPSRELSPVTIVLVAIIAYIIFDIYSHIIGVGVDTIFVCYMEDMERNKDGGLYIDPELHRMLQDKASKNTDIQ